jgi:hypothetical protein
MDVSPNATPGANAIFFSITNSSDSTVSNETLSTTDTSVTIPGGTLLAGQSYSFDLLFDNRIVTQDAALNIPLTQFYDTHTDGSFSTAAGAVPEPLTWAMMLIGFGGLGFAAVYADGSKARRRSAAKRARIEDAGARANSRRQFIQKLLIGAAAPGKNFS